MENLKDKGPYDAEKSVRKLMLVWKVSRWRYESVYEYQKIIKRSFE
jgi:hypothetical protein